MIEKYEKLTQENKKLKRQINELRSGTKCTYEVFKNDDKRTKYFTAFADFDTLETIFDLVKDSLSVTKKMEKFDIFLMTLT